MKLTSVVESVESETKVSDALKLMIKKGVSELAVVGATSGNNSTLFLIILMYLLSFAAQGGGALVGNLCASDFRRLSVYNFSRVYPSWKIILLSYTWVT